MKRDNYEMSLLLDFYGDTLTEKQRYLFDCYYNQDLSLGEIAENEGISRQGVRDAIMRAEASMSELEDKIGMIAKYMAQAELAQRIQIATAQLRKVCKGILQEREVRALADEIDDVASQLCD